eukprot:gnl/TRDRNA2_/TRDRNA2_62583_c0_seq1.p1 gnl/TRDRNA2_/TRDRNA2_62583_c0~~gnl/TRDRNA2_/TRDRNA2_62583_c0_seq1.p1  ORF type:complete len:270 (-),score=22.71 gnl/TRDRNA2_/TRDRNA2_62583_c0_seq1:135-944(-)
MLMGAQRCQAFLARRWLNVVCGANPQSRPIVLKKYTPSTRRWFDTSSGSAPATSSRIVSKLLAFGAVGAGLAAICSRFIAGSAIGPVVPLEKASCETNPRVFLDISVSGRRVGRIEIELFSKVCPKTVENFRCLCTCEKGSGGRSGRGPPLWYNQNMFDCIIPGMMCQAGSYPNESIYGPTFPDEFQHGVIEHSQAMLLAMANDGPNTNGSKFFITLRALPECNGKNVVFGRVTDGHDVVKMIESVGSDSGATRADVQIVNCGQIIRKH